MSDAEIQTMRERLMKLETLVGDDGDNGLRGDIRAIKASVDAMQARIYLAIGGGSTLLAVVQIGIAVWKS